MEAASQSDGSLHLFWETLINVDLKIYNTNSGTCRQGDKEVYANFPISFL